MMRTTCSSSLALAICAILIACKHQTQASEAPRDKRPLAEHSAPAANVAPASEDEPGPAEDPFLLPDDAPIDPDEEQRSLRQNCCDEMPSGEIETHIGATEGEGDGRPRRR